MIQDKPLYLIRGLVHTLKASKKHGMTELVKMLFSTFFSI